MCYLAGAAANENEMLPARTADLSATLLKKCNRVLFMYYSGLPYVLKIIRSTSWSSLQRRSQTVRKYEPRPTPVTYR